jgi:hypothetical protein
MKKNAIEMGRRVHEMTLPDSVIDAFDYFVINVKGRDEAEQLLK